VNSSEIPPTIVETKTKIAHCVNSSEIPPTIVETKTKIAHCVNSSEIPPTIVETKTKSTPLTYIHDYSLQQKKWRG
jgi:hypothetical protein